MEILDGLDPLLRTFWYVAIPSSIIFVIQSIMTFIGLDATEGLEADFDGNLDGADTPFQLFSFRNLINFLLGFSWTGISFYTSISSQLVLISIAIVVGLLFVYVFFVIIRLLLKLAEDNTFKIANTINKTADVYLTIPGNKSGKGKVLVSVNGSVHELDAMTENDQINSNSTVKIIRIENNSILIVETL